MGRRDAEHVAGCVLGGGVGDALGASVEFMSLEQIRSRFGPDGLSDLAEARDRFGAFADDTSMMLLTTALLLRQQTPPAEALDVTARE